MTAEDQIHGARNERIILGMMREQNVDARLSGEGGEPVCFRLVVRCCNRSSDAADTFLTWITLGAAGFGTEEPVIRNISTGQASDCYFLTIDVDGRPLIIQHSYASGGEEIKIILVHHPLVIAEGEKGRSDGGAGMKEGENVGLGSHRTRIIFWPATVQHISGDADEGRGVSAEGGKHGFWICIMQVTQQRQGRGAAWNYVGCLFRRGSPPGVVSDHRLPSKCVHSKVICSHLHSLLLVHFGV